MLWNSIFIEKLKKGHFAFSKRKYSGWCGIQCAHTHLYKNIDSLWVLTPKEHIHIHIKYVFIHTYYFSFYDFIYFSSSYPGTPRTISLCEEIRQCCEITSHVALLIFPYCCQHNICILFWTASYHLLHQGNWIIYLGLKKVNRASINIFW